MHVSLATRLNTLEESIYELDRGFARLILELERRMKALDRSGQPPLAGAPPVPFASSALMNITLPGPFPCWPQGEFAARD